MSIKADGWIRRMAREHGMIEPFVEKQVRDGVISYGLSSYGYDMRVTDEFKVFTNVFNVLVDPKNFSPRSLVDIKGEWCDIPPNSFALARSVEYFRIPRTVNCIVMGKSTYARCFRGDTHVALVDGTSLSLEEMARRSEQGEMFWGYSVGPHGRIIVTLLEQPRYIGRDALIKIVIDNGEAIYCTPDHEFLMRDGSMVAAEKLIPGVSLMPLYRDIFRGYEGVYQPRTATFSSTHHLADEWNLRFKAMQQERACQFWQAGEHAEAREHLRHKHLAYRAVREHRDAQRQRQQHYWENEEIRAARSAFSREVWAPDDGTRRVAQKEVARNIRKHNHRIVGVHSLQGEHDVYCLSVPEAGNFALESGVFVSNCGIIVNVTPLEPEWEGYVTIEISNTTPLPARIYANEGIGQVLFFESDEVCEVSYADRKGKYQQQQGIVLPRIDTDP